MDDRHLRATVHDHASDLAGVRRTREDDRNAVAVGAVAAHGRLAIHREVAAIEDVDPGIEGDAAGDGG